MAKKGPPGMSLGVSGRPISPYFLVASGAAGAGAGVAAGAGAAGAGASAGLATSFGFSGAWDPHPIIMPSRLMARTMASSNMMHFLIRLLLLSQSRTTL